MPLAPGKSQGAFQKNVKTEMAEGKPQKQALAIAYAIQRRNQGGPVVNVQNPNPQGEDRVDNMHRAIGQLVEKIMTHPAEPRLAQGGEVVPDLGPQAEEDEDFFDPAMQAAPEGSMAEMQDNQSDPESEDEDKEQEKGKVDLKHILASVRKRNRGK